MINTNIIDPKHEIESVRKLFGMTRDEAIDWIKESCIEKISTYQSLLMEIELESKNGG